MATETAIFPAWPSTRGLDPTAEYVELTEPLVYEWTEHGLRYRWTVPEGFRTNFASVPHWLWSFVGPMELGPACILHDRGYGLGGQLPGAEREVYRDSVFPLGWMADADRWWFNGHRDKGVLLERWSRKRVDRLFLRMMRETPGIPRWKAEVAYRAVRWFGAGHWGSDAR